MKRKPQMSPLTDALARVAKASYEQGYRHGVEATERALVYETCACGWRTALADPDTAHRMMQLHRLACTAVTHSAVTDANPTDHSRPLGPDESPT